MNARTEGAKNPKPTAGVGGGATLPVPEPVPSGEVPGLFHPFPGVVAPTLATAATGLYVPAVQVAYAVGRVLDHPDTEAEFWSLIAELDKVLPHISWHNLATDSPARSGQ